MLALCHLNSCLLAQNSPANRLRAIATLSGAVSVPNMTRCAQKSFWCQGVKLRSGEARTMIDGTWRTVVCRRAKPGEVNVWELEEGTPLLLPKALTLVFSPRHAKGRRGSAVDVRETLNSLPWPGKGAYLQRIAHSRLDHDACVLVLERGSRRATATIARRARGRVLDGAVREVLESGELNAHGFEGVAPYLTSPELIEEIISLGGPHFSNGEMLGVMTARLYELDATDRARRIVDRAIEAIATQNAWHAAREWGVLAHLPGDELRSALLALEAKSSDKTMLLQDAMACLVERRAATRSAAEQVSLLEVLGEMASRCSHDGSWSMAQALAHAAELAGVGRGAGAFAKNGLDMRGLVREGKKYDPVEEEALVARAVSVPCSFAMNAEEYEGWWLRSELVRIGSARLDEVRDAATEWILAASGIGLSQEMCCGLWQWRMRRDVVLSPRLDDEEFLREIAVHDENDQVVRAALIRLGDDELWKQSLRGRRPWLFMEKAPLHVLRELVDADGPALWAEPRNAMVLLRRGAITPDVTITQNAEDVQIVSVRMTRDETLLRRAVEGRFEDVMIEAGMRSMAIDTVEAALERCRGLLAKRPESGPHQRLVSYLEDRVLALQTVELARVSVRRGDLVTARGALSLLTDRSLIWSLSDEPELLPWLGSALQRGVEFEPF